ncbi:hypothetical protein QOZ80_4BG0347790 [Eleusine coracana subsp. coracana]|nr:hypothetical protein QOZ80_4BG0347790 [Eleusine coracana subsp. coracana]
MLEWYIEFQKDKPKNFTWKKQHHLQCADALNAKYALGVTRNQVDRHWRSCKEKWHWISQVVAKSGNGFDAAACKFNLDPTEKDKDKLGTTKYNYLTRSIKFFHLLQELFLNHAKADGSLALDQSAMNITSDSDDNDSVKELEGYALAGDDDQNDSDIIPRNSPIDLEVTVDPSSGPSKKRKHMKSPTKKVSKASRNGKVSNDEMANSIIMLIESIKSSNNNVAPVQQVAPADPNANVWKRIEDLTFSAKFKLEIATFLSKPEQDNFRGYLNIASEATFQAWVLEFFDKSGGAGSGDLF